MITLLIIIVYLAFISLGLPDSMLGAAWPTIRTSLSLPFAGAGLISMIISGGTIFSSMLSGKLIDKLGTAKLTLFSVGMTAGALLGFSLSKSYLWLCLVALPLGLGAGAVDAALNNFVALHFSAKHMSWLHCFWGIGATGGPIIMARAIAQSGSWNKGYFTVFIVQLLLVVILGLSLPLWMRFQNSKKNNESTELNHQNVFKLPGIFSALIGFFAYCALESTTGLWGASYLVQAKGVVADTAAAWISLYYLGITTGRFLNGFLSTKFENPYLIHSGQLVIGIGVLLLLIFKQTSLNLLGLVLIGVGCAPIYPSMLHETPVRFGANNSSKLMGIQMAFAYMGTTFVPPLLGLIMSKLGVTLYPLFILLLLIVMALGSEKAKQITPKSS